MKTEYRKERNSLTRLRRTKGKMKNRKSTKIGTRRKTQKFRK